MNDLSIRLSGQSEQQLPSRAVTFVFTESEGSIRLAQQFPGDLPSLLARHNHIVEQAVQAHRLACFGLISMGEAIMFALEGTT